jgi:hypothetical protein
MVEICAFLFPGMFPDFGVPASWDSDFVLLRTTAQQPKVEADHRRDKAGMGACETGGS